MPAITAIECFIVDVPTIRPHILAVATMSVQSMVFVRMQCSDGIVGLGEGTTIGGLRYGEESPEGVKLAIETYLTPVALGADPSRPATVMAKISQHVVGNRFAKCAVETALLDAQGKRFGLPVSELLGGRVRDRLPVLWTLASGDTERDIDEAEEMLSLRRHNTFKLKIGKRSIAEDLEHVAAIKRALGDRASIRVDVNQAWSEAVAKQAVRQLADVGVDLIEQPISAANREGMARLSALGLAPIMADEALQGPHSAFDYARAAAGDVFAVKIAQSGGPLAAKAVSLIAEAAGVALYGGTMLEGAIGSLASAHLASTFATLEFGTELFGPLLLKQELLAQPLDYSDFSLAVPASAGLGLVLDEDAVAAHRRDRASPKTVSFSKVAGA